MPSRSSNDFPTLIDGLKLHSITDRDQIEAVHKAALLAAKVHHERVRENALRAYENFRLEEEQQKLLQIKIQEETRLKLEQEQADLAAKVAELQRRKIEAAPIPKIEPPQPPIPKVISTHHRLPVKPETRPPALSADGPTEFQKELEAELEAELEKDTGPTKRPEREKRQEKFDAELEGFFAEHHSPPTIAATPVTFPSNAKQLNRAQKSQQPPAAGNLTVQFAAGAPQPRSSQNIVVPDAIAPPVAKRIDTSHILPGTQEYLEIHRRLKDLRKFMVETAKQHPELKKKMGEGRREIRKSVGQLTEGKPGTNKLPLNKIVDVLRDALHVTQSPPIDPGVLILKRPNSLSNPMMPPKNGNTLPGLFVYLLNMFAKSVIHQLMDEAASKSRAANPIGVIVAHIFAKPEHQWNGSSLIDILIAKFRVVCPVLFGIRGNEKTEEGRARLGWWKENGEWISEQAHIFRMTGLGAGFASIALRDFSKTTMQNPYPPTHYWMSMASIVSTPPTEASPTQYIVLKAMINNFEQRFLHAYGHAALAALQVALVDFPAQQQGREPAANSLMVLGDKLKRDGGLSLTFPPGW